MRFNDRELVKISRGPPTIEGLLQYMKPQNNDWSDWYQPSAYKERMFKLVNNLLFYFRLNQHSEPLGLLVLENVEVSYECPGPAFAFSLVFNDGKHIFACRCQEDLNRWVSALKAAPYQHWRSLYTVLEMKLKMKGKKPIQHVNSDKVTETFMKEDLCVKRASNSVFYSETRSSTTSTKITSSTVKVETLIDL